jgi:hypothetical protein
MEHNARDLEPDVEYADEADAGVYQDNDDEGQDENLDI